MTVPARGTPNDGLISIQARLFEEVIDSGPLSGTLDDLACRFDVTPTILLGCLGGLVQAGWVRLDGDPAGTFTIRLDP